ncbi:helix-turn-helix domain-containing protein [Psychroserpens damuponensis]|uniref:helix-turn-helix domain-containing protein n=1 Tax=Psychroserpens damuponensis TaxID=943936 RepID=UPI000693D68A|nr:helix-turn-helix domain-containing protein [Psychroserpens damuponensis]
MSKEIPHISFKSSNPDNNGIEILTIESLAARKKDANHNPERAHQVAFNMIVFYTHGESKHLVDFIWHPVKKNTLIHISKGQINRFQFQPGLKGYILLFTDDYLKNQIHTLPKTEIDRLFNSQLFSPIIEVPAESNIERYMTLFDEEYSNLNDNLNQNAICNALYTIIFSKLERLKKFQTHHLKHSEKLSTFLEFKSLLENHFNESRNADFYAIKLHITYKHLNTICKDIVAITAKQFIDEFIVLEAKRLLINSKIKSTQLAYSLGFDEPTNFVKYFKKHTGFTLNQFKKDYL